jgi:hypothetical protein
MSDKDKKPKTTTKPTVNFTRPRKPLHENDADLSNIKNRKKK